jgi:hypothetical protein
MWNAKTNGDLKLKINNSSYSDKAPAGQYSFFAEWKLKDATGNVVRLNPGESLELLVQDNLLALISFEAYINGHEVD